MTQRESPEDDSPRVGIFHDHCYRGYFQGYFKLLFSLQRPLVNYSSSLFHLLSPFQRLGNHVSFMICTITMGITDFY